MIEIYKVVPLPSSPRKNLKKRLKKSPETIHSVAVWPTHVMRPNEKVKEGVGVSKLSVEVS